MDLASKTCRVPLPKGTPKLAGASLDALCAQLPSWRAEGDRLVRTFSFRSFADAMRFVNALAALAEAQNHHPDFTVRYAKVEVSSWTHEIGGLSENDFILAAKLDALYSSQRPTA
jgi:4a-hydroxytetrahydrobiopterin dehydratase